MKKTAASAPPKTPPTRKGLIGSGDRSDRIRTYNFPQGRLTDHRINLTLYKLLAIMEGDLDDVVQALQAAQAAEQLAARGEAWRIPADWGPCPGPTQGVGGVGPELCLARRSASPR